MSPESQPILPPNGKSRKITVVADNESVHNSKKKKRNKHKRDKKRKRDSCGADNEKHHSNNDGLMSKKQRTHSPIFESLDTKADLEEAAKEAALEEKLRKRQEKENKRAERKKRWEQKHGQLGGQAAPQGITAPSPAAVIYTVRDIAKLGHTPKPVGETRILPGMDATSSPVKETRIVPGMDTTPTPTSRSKLHRAKDSDLTRITQAKPFRTVPKMSTIELDSFDSDSDDRKEVVAVKRQMEPPQKTTVQSKDNHLNDPFTEAGSSTTSPEPEEGEMASQTVKDITIASNSETRSLFNTEPTTPTRGSNGSNGTQRRRSITINDKTDGGVKSAAQKYEEVPDTWQENPGKVRGRVDAGGDAETEEVIAFSSQHLCLRPHGISFSGINFSVLHLNSNRQKSMSGKGNKDLMICSVARGVVEVVLCGKMFRVGAGGMWRVREGEKCVGKKSGEEAAVVHVTKLAVG